MNRQEQWRQGYSAVAERVEVPQDFARDRTAAIMAATIGGQGYRRVEHATPDDTVDAIVQHAAKLRYGKFAVGIEVVPGRFVAVLTDHTGRRFAKRQREVMDMDPRGLAREIGDVARRLVATELGLDLPSDSVVVGVQLGAPVDSDRGVVLHYRNHRVEPRFSSSSLLWSEPVPLAAYVREETGCRTVVENDAASYAVYEQKHGGHEASSFAIILIRDGIGGGLVLANRVVKIPFEIGHINVQADGRDCLCGKTGCIESVAGRRAMTAIVAKRVGALAPPEFVALAKDHHASAEVVSAFREAGEAVAQGVGAILTMFGLELIVIYHDDVVAEPDIETPATEAFRAGLNTFRDFTFPPLRNCTLETRPLRPTVGAHGAALVALNRLSFVPLL